MKELKARCEKHFEEHGFKKDSYGSWESPDVIDGTGPSFHIGEHACWSLDVDADGSLWLVFVNNGFDFKIFSYEEFVRIVNHRECVEGCHE